MNVAAIRITGPFQGDFNPFAAGDVAGGFYVTEYIDAYGNVMPCKDDYGEVLEGETEHHDYVQAREHAEFVSSAYGLDLIDATTPQA